MLRVTECLRSRWELDPDTLNQASAPEGEREGAQGWGPLLGGEGVPKDGSYLGLGRAGAGQKFPDSTGGDAAG